MGHTVVALANLHPRPAAPNELDSFCFQTVGHQLLDLYPQCTNLPLYRLAFDGHSISRDLGYSPTEGVPLLAVKQQPYRRVQGHSMLCHAPAHTEHHPKHHSGAEVEGIAHNTIRVLLLQLSEATAVCKRRRVCTQVTRSKI